MLFHKLSQTFRRFSLTTHYFVFACALIFIAAFFSMMTGISDYQAYKRDQLHNYKVVADLMNDVLTTIFNVTAQAELDMGRQILANDPNNKSSIYSIFRNYSEIKDDVQRFYSWSLYGWIDKNNKLVVGTRTGIEAIDFTHQAYLQPAKANPWKIQISPPATGVQTSEKVIHATMGITDTAGKFVGFINIGLRLNKLEQELESSITHEGQFSFLVYKNSQIIAASHDNAFDRKDFYLSNQLFSQQEGELEKPLKNGDITYFYYRKMQDYPNYIILVGIKNELLYYQFVMLLFPHLLGFIGIGLISLILIFLFHYWFIKPVNTLSEQAANLANGNTNFKMPSLRAKEIINLTKGLLQVKRYLQLMQRTKHELSVSNRALVKTNKQLHAKKEEMQELYKRLEKAMAIAKKSDNAKEQFLKEIYSDMKMPLHTALKNTQYLITWLQKNPGVSYLQVSHLNYLQQILAAIFELKTFTPTTLQLNLIDINVIINESLLIHRKVAHDKNVFLDFEPKGNIPLIYADELRLKQVLVELISRAIESTPPTQTITITCECVEPNKQTAKHIKIVIEDTGFGLSDEDYQRLKQNFSIVDSANGVNLELDAIQRIIELHQGKFYIRNEWNQGTQVTILLPFINQEE